MTWLYNDPASFTEDMLTGFLDANAEYVVGVPGGVVRIAPTRPGKVAVVVGGGSGHYPAFCGVVGPGFADGAVVGNIFTSPSAADAISVARAADSGAGVLLTTGNYAGDVMNFGLAVEQLNADGIAARYFAVTDDIASAPAGEEDRRRGIAGDFTVFKCASAAAEDGYDLDGVTRVAALANRNTRTLGVAFDGCTLPGAAGPLFTVEKGTMGLGLGIHGEPGVATHDLPAAADLARLLVEGVLEDRPSGGGTRIAVILNGLGRTKYEELFVLWGTVAPLLRAAGYTVVHPEVGELVTSLDMAGCSLTVMWLDDELERLWTAPADTPAYRRGTISGVGKTFSGAGDAADIGTHSFGEVARASGRVASDGAVRGPHRTAAETTFSERPAAPSPDSALGHAYSGGSAHGSSGHGIGERAGLSPSRAAEMASSAPGLVAGASPTGRSARVEADDRNRAERPRHRAGSGEPHGKARPAAEDEVGRGAGQAAGRSADGTAQPTTSGAGGSGRAAVAADAAGRECGVWVARALRAVAAEMVVVEEELGRIDAVAGDGDHGRGMVRGTAAARAAADAAVAQGAGPGSVLKAAGAAWAAQAGGTSGVLWGAALTALGGRLGDVGIPGNAEIAAGVRDAYDALTRLGRAQPGDKTMLDALLPFLVAAERGESWRAAVDIAEAAAQETATLRPRIGRARPLAERSVGSPDAGAISLALCVRTVVSELETVVAEGVRR
nr:dihydroxyacetone kinase family protein [Nocardia wallacei]